MTMKFGQNCDVWTTQPIFKAAAHWIFPSHHSHPPHWTENRPIQYQNEKIKTKYRKNAKVFLEHFFVWYRCRTMNNKQHFDVLVVSSVCSTIVHSSFHYFLCLLLSASVKTIPLFFYFFSPSKCMTVADSSDPNKRSRGFFFFFFFFYCCGNGDDVDDVDHDSIVDVLLTD